MAIPKERNKLDLACVGRVIPHLLFHAVVKPPKRGAHFALEFNPVFMEGGLQGTCHALAVGFSGLLGGIIQ